MREIEIKKGKINTDLLLSYGFTKYKDGFIYSDNIMNGQMKLCFFVLNNKLYSEISDEFGEEYTLHLNESADGEFVGQVKFEYESKVNEILVAILEHKIFKSEQAKYIIDYISDTYGGKIEFLWDDDNGIIRRDDNKKWYIVFMNISKIKLGFKDNSKVEIINLRLKCEDVPAIIDNESFFPAYHMNKKYWISVLLDGGADTEHIFRLIDESYKLVGNKSHQIKKS